MSLLSSESIVVVPWDFTEYSRRALDRAMDLVENAERIRVVYVAYLPVMVGPGMIVSTVNEGDVIKNSETKFRESVSNDPRCNELSFTTLMMDEQGHAICDFAREQNAELIVISSHGRTGLKRLAMGSVAERVVRHASCPVLVLRS